MPGMRSSLTHKALLAMGLLILAAASACAQPAEFSNTFLLPSQKPATGKGAEWHAALDQTGNAGELILHVSVRLAPDHYVYPTTYAKGQLMKFEVKNAIGLEPIDSEFTPNREPESEYDADLKKSVERYHGQVTWSRKYRVKAGVALANVAIDGKVVYQICDANTCLPGQEFAFDVKPGDGTVAASSARPAIHASPAPHFDQMIGPPDERTVGSRWMVLISPGQIQPGGEVTISLQAELQAGWHVYPLDLPLSEEGDSLPTLFGLTELGGLIPVDAAVIGPRLITKPAEDGSGRIDRFHEGRLIWKRKFKVPDDAPAGEVVLAGKIAWQMCTMQKCLLATGFEFSGKLTVADTTSSEARAFTVGDVLKDAQAREAIDEFYKVNRGGTEGVVESDDAVNPAEFFVPPVAKSRELIAAAPVETMRDVEPGENVKGGLATMPLPLFVGTAVLFGFAALLTPCVFPMIPITVSFFQKQAEKEHHRPVTMAVVYCLGIIGAFTGLGMVMSVLFGATALPELANTVVFNLALAALLVFFALNLLGMFEIRMPSWLLTFTASKESKGGFVGVLFMALTFTLTSFTCTFAFAGGLLVMAESGDRLRPILGLLAFSSAFSLPFFFLALFPSMLKKLPKSGGWMNVAKVLMGLLELGAAIKFLGNADQRWNGQPAIFDFHLMIAIWAVISIGAALYLFGIFRLPHDVPTEHIGVMRFITATSLLGFALYLGVGLFGAEKPQGAIWKNVEAFANSTFDVGNDPTGPFVKHGSLKYSLDFERALDVAIAENKPLFLDFTGENCTNCRKMEKGPMSNAEVEARLGKFVRTQLFTDTVPIDDRAEAERLKEYNQRLQKSWFGDITLPSYVVIPPDRSVLKNRSLILSRFEGYDPDHAKFARFLDEGWSKWQKIQARKSGNIVGSR